MRPLVVGVTGGLAAGKSTLCRLLALQGLPVIDADQVAREVTEPGSPHLAELARAFGPEILTADGRLDRGALASRALATSASQARLNGILHPSIQERLAAEVERLGRQGEEAVVIEATLAIESGRRSLYDLLVVVVAADEEKVRRAVTRGMSVEGAKQRLALLWPDAAKVREADRVIQNDGNLAALEAAAKELAHEIRAAAASRRGDDRE